MNMTFKEACEHYLQAIEAAHGHTHGASIPRESFSDFDRSKRWILRDINGLLAYVTKTGRVLNRRLQTIGSE